MFVVEIKFSYEGFMTWVCLAADFEVEILIEGSTPEYLKEWCCVLIFYGNRFEVDLRVGMDLI